MRQAQVHARRAKEQQLFQYQQAYQPESVAPQYTAYMQSASYRQAVQQPQMATYAPLQAQQPQTSNAPSLAMVPPPAGAQRQQQAQQAFLQDAGSYFTQAAGGTTVSAGVQQLYNAHAPAYAQQPRQQQQQQMYQQQPASQYPQQQLYNQPPPQQQQYSSVAGAQQRYATGAPAYAQRPQQQQLMYQQRPASQYPQQQLYYEPPPPQQQQYGQQTGLQGVAQGPAISQQQRQQQHAVMMMQQIPGTPPSPPPQLSQAQMQLSPIAAILPKPGGAGNGRLAKGQVFPSDRAIQKLRQGNTLFRLFSAPESSFEKKTPAGNRPSAPSGGHPSRDAQAVDSQGSPRGVGDDQDSLFKLFTASPSAFGAPPPPPSLFVGQIPQGSTDGGSKAAQASTSDDSAELPQTPNDVAAMKDLAALSQAQIVASLCPGVYLLCKATLVKSL